ncbi:immunoglobulin superfamily member 6 isoform X1 [Pteropus alecto]|uniref:immunoglobulin superfamily member 6 isoform X1 n=1 Tax=Pteropus alecto TaxID=9402 RepID=UPI000D532752|nr:immunoglobulin superfamily member 6 isoform X1 [Pteropus alecto]
MFTQFQKVPDYGSLIRLPLFSSSVPKREKKKARGHHTHTRTHTHAHAHARAHSEMEAMDAGKITLGLELGLILFYVGAAGNCTVSVSQPPVLEVDYTQGAVTVPCSFSTTGCPSQPPTSLWFRLGAQQLESLCSDGCQSEADKFTVRTDLAHSQVSLTVNRVTANDSAIYICGIAVTSSKAPQAKRAGEGTVLVVRGPWAPASPTRRPDRDAHSDRERCQLAAPAPPVSPLLSLLGQGHARGRLPAMPRRHVCPGVTRAGPTVHSSCPLRGAVCHVEAEGGHVALLALSRASQYHTIQNKVVEGHWGQ